MEGFDEDVYVGQNDVVGEENVHGDYGFDGSHGGAPPTPPPMDGLLGNVNDGMHSQEGYGFSGDGDGGDHEQAKPYDLGADNEGIFAAEEGGGPLLPEPNEMREQGSAFREWRRQNMIYLEEKENKEKELRNQIIAEADEWKRKFYEKRSQTCETNKAHNREREKLYYSQQEKFHKEADNQFWKAIAEIIPREVPNFEKRRGKKDDEKKPAVLVIQGPKPGKPTDMARMRQILAKLKTTPPLHMRPPPPPAKDGKNEKSETNNKSSEDGKEKKDVETGETKSKTEDGKEKKDVVAGETESKTKDSLSSADAAADGGPKADKPVQTSAAKGKENVEK
ncbi:hypothetical protein C2S52_012908 [Perilla frutescens var. hirtella]|nr:hypothetical protein C2S52_012908 [Perilla frutescens var. hirtella]